MSYELRQRSSYSISYKEVEEEMIDEVLSFWGCQKFGVYCWFEINDVFLGEVDL